MELRFLEALTPQLQALSPLPLPEGSVLAGGLPAAVSRRDLGTSRCLHIINSKRRLVEPGPSQLKGKRRGLGRAWPGLGRGVVQTGAAFHSTPLASASHVAPWGWKGLGRAGKRGL